MFEKNHQIATLKSSLEQSENDKVKLSEETTELRRLVVIIQFSVPPTGETEMILIKNHFRNLVILSIQGANASSFPNAPPTAPPNL